MLVADDDPDARGWMRAALESAGYEVSEVHDGGELYDVLTTSPVGHFHAVVADHGMPRMLGLEVLARTSARTRFILVTGTAGPGVEAASRRLGAVAFFRKPLDPSALLRAVQDAIAA